MKITSLLLSIALVLGCRAPETPAASGPRTPREGPHDGGTLVRRLEADAGTLNYALQTTDYERQLLDYIYDPLVALDANLQPIPATAAKWEVSPDGLTYTFHLDPRSTFSDGTKVKASDVIFTIMKIVDTPSPQFAGNFEALDRDHTKAADEKTAVVAFRERRVAQIYAFNIGVLPEHVYGKGDFKKDFADVAVGNGPYRLADRKRGATIRLERRSDYWREKPHLATILFKVIGVHTTAWNAIQHGDVDETRVKSDQWFFARNDAALQRKIELRTLYLLRYNCIPWNLRDPLFGDKRVRKALAMLFDRQSIIDNIYHGQARPITGPFTPDQWAYNPSVPAIPFDPRGAAALLADAGWRDTDGDHVIDRGGRKFSFSMLVPAGDTISFEQAQVFQDALKNAGIEMRIEPLDGATFFKHVMSGDFQAASMAWTLDPFPDIYPLFHSKQRPPAGLNVVSYANPEIDGLIDQSRTELNPEKRTAIYRRMHEILADDQPYLWTVQVGTKWAINRRVHDVRDSKGFGLFEWYPGPLAWWVK